MLDTKYEFNNIESKHYQFWLDNNYFEADKKDKEPYAIVIPPPNVTGKLHLGHAWDGSIQDIIIRFKRMQGYDAMYLPGMDHAGIATQAKIDQKLRGMGINPREIGREKWLEYAWDWKKEYSENIHSQWAKMGLSLCYSKERFTLDENLSKAVNHVFIKMYEEGLIYRGERIINWDPEAMTALSNEEVNYKDVKGAFYYIKYMIKDSEKYLTVATTRPETIFGDTAVAVNKDDDRYKDLIGKTVILPVLDKEIPVIADEHADPEFGSGVVKITPAHDINDFEVGLRHNLEKIVCINPDGKLNENAGEFNGLDRFDARKKLVEKLKELDLLIKIEEMTHSVGHSERTNVMIEPYLSKQWFVKMRPLADNVLTNQKDKENKVNFHPARFEKIMNHWMEITYDWCISRQLWWGHRIPAWYKGEEVYVGTDAPSGEGWIQDEDVLDTWFSSALWPFSTLGWPDTNAADFKRYYPNNTLVTGYDIIPFWVNRMTFQGLHFTNERPFKDCLIHGLIRDNEGRKMSKSLGNGVDPMDVIDKYGTDALRYFLTTSSALGMDLRYDEEKVASSWNFLNKLWNASRYTLLNTELVSNMELCDLEPKDKWILSKLNKTIKEVTKNMESYDFNIVGSTLYNFTWESFCDNYIEMSKFSLDKDSTKNTLLYVLTNIIKMLHPFVPFITEEIYQSLPVKDSKSIVISSYPIYNKEYDFSKEEKEIDEQIEFIKAFRNIKLENKMTNELRVKYNNNSDYTLINNILKLNDKKVDNLDIKEFLVATKNYSITIYFEKEESKEDIELKEKKISSLKASIERRNNLLSNKGYVANAPKELVEKEKENLAKEESELNILIGG